MMRFRLAPVICVLYILFVAGGGSAQSLSSLLSKSQFETMLKNRNNAACPARGFYTYEAFIQAARSFRAFGNTGDINTRKREIAAFFGQTSHETTGGWPSAPDGPYAWGYCHKEERGSSARYRGRGPIQLTHDYNYGQAGRAIGVDLRNNPDLVAKDPVVSFKTALWFWMTPQAPKPSAHDVITGRWRPSPDDFRGRRAAGYGLITNIINGGIECGKGNISPQQQDRIGFYRRYCSFLGVSPGDNLDCAQQRPYGR